MINPSEIECLFEEQTDEVQHDGIIKQTEKAVLFNINEEDVWIPKSLLAEVNEESFWAASWWVEKEGYNK